MSFRAARLRAGMTPVHRDLPYAAGYASTEGALLVQDSNGLYAECGANPAAIAAVAESAGGADTSGFVATGYKEFPPGELQGILVANEQPFHCEYMGTLPAAVGGTYGVTKDTDGKWKVDFTKSASNQRVKLTSLQWTEAPLNRNRVVVVFLAANVQIIGG